MHATHYALLLLASFSSAVKLQKVSERDVFNDIDTNDDGFIDADELVDIEMQRNWPLRPETTYIWYAEDAIRDADWNRDGKLNIEEAMGLA